MSAFDWLKINNKYDFQLANRFAQREFFKFFITKDNQVRTDEFAAILILLHPPFQIPGDTYHLISLIKEPTCYKNPSKPSCIDLILTNKPRSFQHSCVMETSLSDIHKMTVTVMGNLNRDSEL